MSPDRLGCRLGCSGEGNKQSRGDGNNGSRALIRLFHQILSLGYCWRMFGCGFIVSFMNLSENARGQTSSLPKSLQKSGLVAVIGVKPLAMTERAIELVSH
jgi:hypothetical protein